MPKQIGSLILYEVDELSELLKVQEKTIRDYFRKGKLQGRKFAGKWYITEEQLREYFEEPEKLDKAQEKGEIAHREKAPERGEDR
jgi:DeoR/GlpR family transcriptional regulator of sugar metabolism